MFAELMASSSRCVDSWQDIALGSMLLAIDVVGLEVLGIRAMTSILGIHLVLLGFGALLLVYKAVSLGGIYDTWAPGGGDVRRVSHPTLRPSTILAYLPRLWTMCLDRWTSTVFTVIGDRKQTGTLPAGSFCGLSWDSGARRLHRLEASVIRPPWV